MDFRVVRSARKTCALVLLPDGSLEVRVPRPMPRADIERLVAKHGDWIERRRAQLLENAAARLSFNPDEEGLPLLGRRYPVRRGADFAFDPDAGFTLPQGDFQDMKKGLTALYRRLAAEILLPRARALSASTGIVPSSIKISSASTRWGSCSGRNSVNLSWRLVLASPADAGYVIVHELCHVLEHNHSPRFWRFVERIAPDCRDRKKSLSALSRALRRAGFDL